MLRLTPHFKGGVIYEKIYELVLYEDMFSFNDIKTRVSSIDCTFVVILHDQDTDKNGILKKAHYHVLLSFPNPRSINAVASLFGVGSQLVQWKNNFKESVKYLFHISSKAIEQGKHVYPLDVAFTNIPDLDAFLNSAPNANLLEGQDLRMILDYIQQFNVCSHQLVLEFCIENGLTSTLRRNATFISKSIVEQKGLFNESDFALHHTSFYK